MKKKRFEKHSQLLFFYLRGSKRFFLASVLFSFMVSMLDLINPRIIAFTVDSVIGDEESSLPGFVLAWIDTLPGGAAYFKTHLPVIALVVIMIAPGRRRAASCWVNCSCNPPCLRFPRSSA